MEVITIFSANLKREIKKQGYLITEFAPKVLEISIPTFNKKCKDGSFTLVEIVQIEQKLKVSFKSLCIKIDGYSYPKPLDLKSLRATKRLETPKTDIKKETNHGLNDLSYLDSIL
jgi:hypothetical protein